MTDIFIYKTNVSTQRHVQQVRTLFERVLSIKRWTFDLEDCDKVLRIEAHGLRPETIAQLLVNAGIFCEPLEYEL